MWYRSFDCSEVAVLNKHQYFGHKEKYIKTT